MRVPHARLLLVLSLVCACNGQDAATDPPLLVHQLAEAPLDLIATHAVFGDRVALVGYTIAPRTLRHAAGDEIDLTLVWRVDRPLDPGWAPFTHVVDASGRMLANLDTASALRRDAATAPSRWSAGTFVLDRLRFRAPAAQGRVTLLTGFYRGRERLPVVGGQIEPGYGAAVIHLTVAGAPPVPEVSVARDDDRAMVLDGSLDEPVWQRAARVGPFVSPRDGMLSDGPLQARARLFWTEEHLYVAFEVRDSDVRADFPADAVDPHLWLSDTVELMVDPDGDNRDYREIQINPAGQIFDSRFDAYNQPRGGPDGPFGHERWQSQLERGVRVDGSVNDPSDGDRGYVVEARIPWRSLGEAPRLGDSWRLNLYAISGGNDAVAWSPIFGLGNFHRASRFGRVTWTGE